ncbi:MAG: hypothetical protein EBV34_13245 [Betaproteobacteria bacterium]|nr:hypothetical protein [Betaproteobacteria bacterium]NDE53545.1 hypothetical protein [Actinomycetota bacterium]
MALTGFDPLLSGLGRFQSQQGSSINKSASPSDVAQGFESLLIRQFLSAARSGSIDTEDQRESGWLEMADDAMAGYLASRGGLGLARQIASLLEQGNSRRLGSFFGRPPSLDPVASAMQLSHASRAAALNVSPNPTVVPFVEVAVTPSTSGLDSAGATQLDTSK